MERVTLRMPERYVWEIEQMAESGEFANRSEGIRIAVRDMLKSEGRIGNATATNTDRPWAKY